MNNDLPMGLPGDYRKDADAMARRVLRAVSRKTGTYLTADMVNALDQIMDNGDWWSSFKETSHDR